MTTKRHARWSFDVGSVGGIPIRIHTTFILLLVWLILADRSASPMLEALFVIGIFTCVLLHELAHALVGKRFGVQTRDITLYPFGGIASITSQPTPVAELAIALAGPLVNVIIALAVYPWVQFPSFDHPQQVEFTFLVRFFFTNTALALFNLLPALPMDGGRVLRALLALLSVRRATLIAARISQFICVLLGITALYLQQPMLFVIAFIIFIGAMQEHVRAETRAIALTFTAGDVMIPRERLEALPHGTTISKALRVALTSLQPLFPVFNGEEFLGVLFREDIFEHAAVSEEDYIGEIIHRSLPNVTKDEPLSAVLQKMEEQSAHVASVSLDEKFVGLVVHEQVADFLVMHEIRRNLPKDDDIEWSTPL